MMTRATTPTLAEGAILVSVWKPILLLIPMVAWAWVISKVYDKHAERFHLNRTMWNLIHLALGLFAFAAALTIPIRHEGAFWLGLGVVVVILALDLTLYAVVANRDERVPAEQKIGFERLVRQLSEARQRRQLAKRQGKVELVVIGADRQQIPPPDKETPEFEVRVAAEAFILRGLDLRASQADLAPTGTDSTYACAYLVHGMRQAGETMPAAIAARVIDFWKSAAKLDLNDRRRKLVGDVRIERAGHRVPLRLITSGTSGGMRLTVLYDPERAVRRRANDLGLLEPQLAELRALVEDPRGVVLLAAPPDMGRTTTLYSVLRMHDAYTQNVQTAEMDPQDLLEGVRQNHYTGGGEGPEFCTFVRSILRRDPQVVGVAELPDEATAREIARADLDRTRVYVSLRADSALEAVQTWTRAVGDTDRAARALAGVLAQRLVRRLCPNCRVPYQPSADMLKKLGIPADKPRQLFKKGGQVLIKNRPEVCPMCQGVGYVAQEGVFEVYRIGAAEQDAIRAGNWAALRAAFRKRPLPTLQQAALRKVLEGVTSVEELLRVAAGERLGTGGESPASQPSGAKPPQHAPAGGA